MTTIVARWPNTGLSKHGDPVSPHSCPFNQNLFYVTTRGEGGYAPAYLFPRPTGTGAGLVVEAGAAVGESVSASGAPGQRFPLFSQFSPLFPVFCPRFGDPREGRGDVAIPPTHGPPRRQGLGSLGWRRE